MNGSAAPARFIVFEGGDGSGKTTQAGRLVGRLHKIGLRVAATFEPGATALGRQLRSVLLDGDEPVGPLAEALLMAADRAQHVAEVIRPALDRGAWVVSDRFVGSSLAYQGAGRGLGIDVVRAINEVATDGLAPDVVVYLDVPASVLETRRSQRPDRIERAGPEFLAAVCSGYQRVAQEQNWVVIDGTEAPDVIEQLVWSSIEERLLR
jgi:dTMP kinase